MQADAASQPSGDTVRVDAAAVPAVPLVKHEELWFDTPKVLVDGGRYTIGWQRWPEKKGGPGYVTVRRSALGTFKIVDRYPLTDEGWAQAWMAFVKLEPAMAERARAVLAQRAEADSGFKERKQLNARSLAYLPEVIFIGGYLAEGSWLPGRCMSFDSWKIGCQCSGKAA